VLLELSEKLLRVAPSLGARACLDVCLDFLPLLSVEPERLQKEAMFVFRPASSLFMLAEVILGLIPARLEALVQTLRSQDELSDTLWQW
jgi:hypothetical protein